MLSQITHSPVVLEIGVDRGVTFLPLANWLARYRTDFFLLGIDVKVQEEVVIMASAVDRVPERQVIDLWQMNSLDALPKIAAAGQQFDLVLIDGDHNYVTVSRELAHLNDITHGRSVVLVDDYDGRWSERDLWYAERPGYEDCDIATKRVASEKQGVKAAVDEFLAANPQWKTYQPIKGEPIVLSRAELVFGPAREQQTEAAVP